MVFLSNDTRKRLVLVALSLALWGACSRVDVTVFEDPADVRANGGGAPLGGLGGASGPIPGDGLGGFGGEVDVLVDDFEDGDTKAIDPAQWWYGVNDGTGTQTISVIASAELEAPPLANGSFVLQVTSAGFSGWGAAFGLDVAGFDFGPGPLEVAFAAAAEREMTISLHALDGSGTHFVTNFSIGPEWTSVRIRLDELFVVEGDSVRWFDVGTLDELQWFVYGEEISTVWIDNLAFRSF